MGVPSTSLLADSDGKGIVTLSVTSVDIKIDPASLDRVFVVHSEENEPIALRISPVDLHEVLKNLAVAVIKSLN